MPSILHDRINGRWTARKILLLIICSFIVMGIFIWINELFDISHLLLGGQPTPINWGKAFTETIVLGLVCAVVVFLVVQTMGKNKEIRIKYSKEKVLSDILIQESPVFFTAISSDGKTIMMNDTMLKKLGYTKEEVIGKAYVETFIPQREHQYVKGILSRLVGHGQSTKKENRILAKDGTEYLIEWQGRSVLKHNGELDFICAYGTDITERKKAEEAVRESEEKYRSFVQNLQGIAFRSTMDNMPVFLHGMVQEITGYSEQDFLCAEPKWEQLIHPEDYSRIQEMSLPLKRIPHYSTELTYRIMGRDGKVRWLHEYVRNICNAAGQPEYLQGMVYDITKDREAKENLRKSDERYRLLAENVQDVIWVVDRDFRYTYISPSILRFRGYTVEEAMALPLESIFTPESYKKLLDLKNRKLSLDKQGGIDPKSSITVELEQCCKNGSTIWTEVTASYLMGDNGRPEGFVGITRNITERKKYEETLKESEGRYRTIFENTGTATAIVDEDVTISLANSQFEKLSGYPRASIENKKCLTDFVRKEDSERILEYHNLRRTDPVLAPRNYEFRFMNKDGNTKDVFVTANIIPGTTKSVISLLDITEMKKTEQRLMHSQEQLRNLHKHAQDVREGERTRIAREIHDELGQVLTALKMDLAFLSKKIPEDLEPLHTKANHMLKFIDMTIQSVKRITMDLRPGLLDHLGLVPAIEWQADEFQTRTGITCCVHVEPEDIQLDEDESTTVFRIFQETLTNVARHADATRVDTFLRENDGTLEMIVKDNGKGITKKQIEDSKSFGLMGIKERAYFCGGQVSFLGEKDRGTTVIVSIPVVEKGGS